MRTYVTTAIPYVNADPHVGFALEAVLADAIARHRAHRGHEVRLLTGTDDNSLKSLQAAERERVPVPELVGRYAGRFRELREILGLRTDDFIATSTDPRHRPGVEAFWQACSADLYRGHYSGRYCSGCERFVDSDEPDCAEHPGETEHVEEENWFFRLSRYQDALLDLLESGRLRVVPSSRRNEMLAFVRSCLRDFSVSRSAERARGWGISVPGDPDQVIYVWFDALLNYLNAADGWWDAAREIVHVIGKDIVRFHALYWPAMLLSAGRRLPDTIVSHGFVTVDGRKMSKSLGNVLDPASLVATYGTDAVRWFLLRHVRTTEDGDITIERFETAHDAELADQLGNLVSRTLRMVSRYCDGVVPPPCADRDDLVSVGSRVHVDVDAAMDAFAVHDAVAAVWRLIAEANRYVVRTEPWSLAKRGETTALQDVLARLVEALRVVAFELRAFLPATAAEIEHRIGLPKVASPEMFGTFPATGRRVTAGDVLFPKLRPAPRKG